MKSFNPSWVSVVTLACYLLAMGKSASLSSLSSVNGAFSPFPLHRVVVNDI